ncbi:glutamate receptor 3.7 [Syzygium oleosum]|uniref:glutamate receptor 3.7 n=1 Tax=Syzygium oleosum TaxID=219896 RepID=UPI0011D26731|nr:glutamate receptor 3.7 [Syzygium oleosum]
MRRRRAVVLLPLLLALFLVGPRRVRCGGGPGGEPPPPPAVVRVGAIFTHDSVVGRSAKAAMEAAVADVNADPSVLNGTELRLFTEDANCSVFMGTVETFKLIGKDVVAIIGPQSSATAHTITEIADNLQIPLISYSATDPTLSAQQFPYFVRTAQSDSYQMAAMADLINYYGWKDVIAIYIDDDFGRNGIYALGDELERKMMKISYRLPLPVQYDSRHITDALNKSKRFGPRVYVVHVNFDPAFRIFTIAQELQMMGSDYVWLATDWVSATLDSLSPKNQTSIEILKGVVALRPHTPDSVQKRAFIARWRDMQTKGLTRSGLNTYGLCAYDTVWAVAHAINRYINENGNITFPFSDALYDEKTKDMRLGKLKVFDGGSLLLKKLLQLNFTGLTGQIYFSPDRNVPSNGYDVINIDQRAIRLVGFWSNKTGIEGGHSSYTRQDQKLHDVTWPSGKTEIPRGWVVADSGNPLRIGVPNRFSFTEFVLEDQISHTFQGYCVDVFNEARSFVPYEVPFRFEAYGDGHSNPSYDGLIKMVANNEFDAAVGDIAISTNRTKIVDFSQPFASSGLVIVASINNSKSSAWVFLQPFSAEMWVVTAASFVMIAVVIWILEHRVNSDFRGPPKRQLATMFLFSFSTMFKKNQEDTVSPLGRMVMVVWLFLLMVITSSYTASLSSILTVQQLSSPITGIDSLIASNWPIGYQVGSFAHGYLEESLYVSPSRLIPLGSPEEYERALRLGPSNGGVAAIVDEEPYVDLFLSKHTQFGIIGQAFTSGGWGFAFQRGSPLAVDISTAILKLSESGKLQKIHEKWFCKMGCPSERGQDSKPEQLHLISFWGLYLLCGVVSIAALLVFLIRMICLFVRFKKQQMATTASLSVSSNRLCSDSFYKFLDFVDQKEDATKLNTPQSGNAQQLLTLSTREDVP